MVGMNSATPIGNLMEEVLEKRFGMNLPDGIGKFFSRNLQEEDFCLVLDGFMKTHKEGKMNREARGLITAALSGLLSMRKDLKDAFFRWMRTNKWRANNMKHRRSYHLLWIDFLNLKTELEEKIQPKLFD